MEAASFYESRFSSGGIKDKADSGIKLQDKIKKSGLIAESGFYVLEKTLNYFTIVISSTMCFAFEKFSITHNT